MILPPSLSSLLESLESESERLQEASTSVSPNIKVLVERIKTVKTKLKEVEEKLLKFMVDDNVDAETKENIEDFVIEAMSKAEKLLYPEDYELDKLVFSLLVDEDDELLRSVNSFKDVIEALTQPDVEMGAQKDDNKEKPVEVADSSFPNPFVDIRNLGVRDDTMEDRNGAT